LTVFASFSRRAPDVPSAPVDRLASSSGQTDRSNIRVISIAACVYCLRVALASLLFSSIFGRAVA
jgi:hypothetical protein